MKLAHIKEKCPNAFTKFKFWKDREITSGSRHFVIVRDLYTFFDKQRIWIEVCPEYNFGEEYVNIRRWFFTINNGTYFKGQSSDNKPYESRKECEEAAFYSSFFVLEENILNKKKKI